MNEGHISALAWMMKCSYAYLWSASDLCEVLDDKSDFCFVETSANHPSTCVSLHDNNVSGLEVAGAFLQTVVIQSFEWSSVINTHDSIIQNPFSEMKSLMLWCGSSCAQFGTKSIWSCDYIKYILRPIKQRVFWYSCQVLTISVWS